MTRAKLSAAILLTLIIIGVCSCIWVNRRCNMLLSHSGQVMVLAENGDASAADECTALVHEWEDFRRTAAMLMLNSRFAGIDSVCARLEAEDFPDKADISEFSHLLNILKNSEIPHLRSVL